MFKNNLILSKVLLLFLLSLLMTIFQIISGNNLFGVAQGLLTSLIGIIILSKPQEKKVMAISRQKDLQDENFKTLSYTDKMEYIEGILSLFFGIAIALLNLFY